MAVSTRTAPWIAGLALALVIGAPGVPAAQVPRPVPEPAITVEPSNEAATIVLFNRPIASLRATVLGRHPADRAASAARAFDELVAEHVTGPIETRPFEGGVLIRVGSRLVLALTSQDIDVLAGETIDGVASQSAARLRQALDEAAEARAPLAILLALLIASFALAATVGLLWGLARAHRGVVGRVSAAAERTVAKTGIADLDMLRASRLVEFQQRLASGAFVALGLIVTYVGVTFVLRQFPYTRPWGESMRTFLLTTVENLGGGMVRAIPGLFSALLILVVARFMVRLVRLWFDAIERGRVTARWIHPETAQPTRRLLSLLVWLFAIVMAYPYLPGSQTEAFKGFSVFLGLMVTFGSSGLVNQIMSGFMITYSRALRVGDFVRVGDVEGTVTHLGVLSTKVKTLLSEEVTVPNAVVISTTITDYSRPGDTVGVLTPTSVTIGYDAPWRQVQALLLLAAERTNGLRHKPAPLVLQAALDDFYVKYTLYVSLEDQESRLLTMDALHASIQDLFNEYGVQIMSPNYVLDPAAKKIIAKKDWFAAPARPDPKIVGV